MLRKIKFQKLYVVKGRFYFAEKAETFHYEHVAYIFIGKYDLLNAMAVKGLYSLHCRLYLFSIISEI